jgi:DNA polymerase-3 subunit beta
MTALDGLLRVANKHKAIRLHTEDAATLSLTLTEETTTIVTRIPVQVREEGAISLAIGLLSDTVRALPSNDMEMEQVDASYDDQQPALSIKTPGHEAVLNGSEEFPEVPSISPPPARSTTFGALSFKNAGGDTEKVPLDGRLRMDGLVLTEATRLVTPSAASDDSRPILTGIEVSKSNGKVQLVAADGFRLSNLRYDNIEMTTSTKRKKAYTVIRASALKKASQILGHKQDSVDILFSMASRDSVIRFGNTELIVTGLRGKFPNHKTISAPEITSNARILAPPFRHAANTAALFASDYNGALRLIIEPSEGSSGKVVVTGRSVAQGQYETAIEAEVEGSGGEVFINKTYLSSILDHIGNEISLEFSSRHTPLLLRRTNKDVYEFLYVVMPMHIDPEYY